MNWKGQRVRVGLGQINPTVGDLEGNAAAILAVWRQAAGQGCDLVVFPELAVTGYPPEDLLLKPEFVDANLAVLQRLAAEGPAGTAAAVGFVGAGPGGSAEQGDWDVAVSTRDLRNSAAVLAGGEVVGSYAKRRLPNYGVFDEARYFVPGEEPLVVSIAGVPVGITICEDLWSERGPVAMATQRGARVVASLNASPFHQGKRADRERWIRHHVERHGTPLLYVNQVGGQDELVFDGDSVVWEAGGPSVRAAQFETDLVVTDLDVPKVARWDGLAVPGFAEPRPSLLPREDTPRLDPVAEVWHALVLGTCDYCRKNGFQRAVIGLSGGIDSAVTAAIAVDALGPANVLGVLLPSPYSSDHSVRDAEELAANLDIDHRRIAIDPAMQAFHAMLEPVFAGHEADVTEENLQARIRGVVLMAISNKFDHIVLTTGNKTELAVGYATLYGDMAGGFAILKDCRKELVYALAKHRNERGPGIPESTLSKPPSAELRPGQLDSDSLPPYEILDPIVEAYVEDDQSAAEIVAMGFDEETVRRVVGLIDAAEYKRRQAAPGVKITDRAFGKDRRVPITNGWRG